MNDTRISPPCFKCEERYQGCHASCVPYRTFCEELNEAKAKRHKYDIAKDFQIRNMNKGIREKERRTPR